MVFKSKNMFKLVGKALALLNIERSVYIKLLYMHGSLLISQFTSVCKNVYTHDGFLGSGINHVGPNNIGPSHIIPII